jgi:hypothetical protein
MKKIYDLKERGINYLDIIFKNYYISTTFFMYFILFVYMLCVCVCVCVCVCIVFLPK